ncbi:MAG: hypothetical protein JO010_13100 [Alphaproteobacteria bacterium]|nr:hypothetical protein [Alphaproteobacteria bacterium]
MSEADLHRIIRETYAEVMEKHAATATAFRECVALVRKHYPDCSEPELRRAVAKMIAEEPIV